MLRNTGRAPVLLDGYYLRRKVSTYPFPPGTQILPGRTLTVRIGKGAATSLVQYWGRPAPAADQPARPSRAAVEHERA